jgi:ribonuclease/clavin/mitogillin
METQSATMRPEPLSRHVIRVAIPSQTLPPATETNTYVIMSGREAAVIDLGSNHADAVKAIADCLRDHRIDRVVGLVATHYHRDHIEGLPTLAEYLAARHAAPPLYMHPRDIAKLRHTAPLWQAAPERLTVGSVELHVLHAPGHTHGHLHIWIPSDAVLLVGDHLSGAGTVWVGPPDGHMTLYLESLASIADTEAQVAGPGHGEPLRNAAAAARTLRDRRLMRERQIMELLSGAAMTSDELTDAVYAGTLPPGARGVARSTVRAHLLRLLEHGTVTRTFDPGRGQFVYRAAQ